MNPLPSPPFGSFFFLGEGSLLPSLFQGTFASSKKRGAESQNPEEKTKKLTTEQDKAIVEGKPMPSQAPEEKTKKIAAKPSVSKGSTSASRSTRPVSPWRRQRQ